jgi:hypothetical protein
MVLVALIGGLVVACLPVTVVVEVVVLLVTTTGKRELESTFGFLTTISLFLLLIAIKTPKPAMITTAVIRV